MKCPGRLIHYLNQTEENTFKVSKEHTHVGDGRIAGKVQAINVLKRKATEYTDNVRSVTAKMDENVGISSMASLAKTPSLVQNIRRARLNSEMPINPTRLADLVLPEQYVNIGKSRFLLYDSGPGAERILIFSTNRNLEYLKRVEALLTDGTFDIVPSLFEQLYTIQGCA